MIVADEDYNIVLSFKANKSLLQELDLYAANHKMSRSEVIRMALVSFLSKEKGEVMRMALEKGKDHRTFSAGQYRIQQIGSRYYIFVVEKDNNSKTKRHYIGPLDKVIKAYLKSRSEVIRRALNMRDENGS